MTNVYTEWVNVVHFCSSWSIWFIPAGGGGGLPLPWTTSPPPLDPLPPSPLCSSNALGGGGFPWTPPPLSLSSKSAETMGFGNFFSDRKKFSSALLVHIKEIVLYVHCIADCHDMFVTGEQLGINSGATWVQVESNSGASRVQLGCNWRAYA